MNPSQEIAALRRELSQLKRQISRAPRPHVAPKVSHPVIVGDPAGVNVSNLAERAPVIIHHDATDKHYLAFRVGNILKKIEIT
jgi:hypothetical protein